jgi:DNA-binding protein HU-beta
MNKSELITRVAANNDITQATAKTIVNDVFTQIEEAVKNKGKVSLLGFGNFSIVERKARTGRNPQTGAPLEIPAKNVVKFKAQF